MDNFEKLDVVIPEWPYPSHPFSRGKNPKFHKHSALTDRITGDTDRTRFFEKTFVALFWKLGRPVPYAFRTADGAVRSMDAGCMKFLENQKNKIEFVFNSSGEIIAATPSQSLLLQFEMMKEKLLETVKPKTMPVAQIGNTYNNFIEVPLPLISQTLEFLLSDAPDQRRKEESYLVVREGAKEFRQTILSAWKKCAVSGCSVGVTLDAAHIFRYLGPQTNDSRNGIALRTDIHRLFDKHLLSFEQLDCKIYVRIADKLLETDYAMFDGKELTLPSSAAEIPDSSVLSEHFRQFITKLQTIDASD